MLVSAQPDDPVMKVEMEWADALVSNDLETVSELMHPLFRLVRSYDGASALSKEDYLALPGMKVHSTDLRPLTISYHGNIATILMDYRIDWESPAGKLPDRFKILDILIHTEAGWRVLERVSEVANE